MDKFNLDTFKQGSIAEAKALESEFRKLLTQLDEDVPTISESIFVSRYLPHMANWKIPFPWTAWVKEVSYMAANPVNVIGTNGEVVCTVPPLCNTDELMSTRYASENSITHQASEAVDLAQRMQHIGQQVYAKHLSGFIPKGKRDTKWTGVWDAILTRYGYPTTKEVLAKYGKSNNTDTLNTIETNYQDIYEDGDLL